MFLFSKTLLKSARRNVFPKQKIKLLFSAFCCCLSNVFPAFQQTQSQVSFIRKFVSIVHLSEICLNCHLSEISQGYLWNQLVCQYDSSALIRFIFSPSWISYSWQLKTSACPTNSFSVQLIFSITFHHSLNMCLTILYV